MKKLAAIIAMCAALTMSMTAFADEVPGVDPGASGSVDGFLLVAPEIDDAAGTADSSAEVDGDADKIDDSSTEATEVADETGDTEATVDDSSIPEGPTGIESETQTDVVPVSDEIPVVDAPDTGVTGASAMGLIAACAAGAMLLTGKRRK